MRPLIARVARSLRNRGRTAAHRLRGRVSRMTVLAVGDCGPGLSVGRGVRIDAYGELRIGANVRLEDGCHLYVGPGATLVVGDGAFVGRQTTVVASSRIEIGSHTLIAEHVSIRDSDHPLDTVARRVDEPGPTEPLIIGRDVWIGAGARVLRGARLGDGTVVGANSVVTRPFDARQVLVGAPARAVRTIPESSRS